MIIPHLCPTALCSRLGKALKKKLMSCSQELVVNSEEVSFLLFFIHLQSIQKSLHHIVHEDYNNSTWP